MMELGLAGSFGILLARWILGFGIAAHGAQKMFGMFNGPGLTGAGGFMETLGFRPGKIFAFIASLTELGAGALLVLGLGGPLAPALVIMMMIVGASTVHLKNGFFASNSGIEVNLLYSATALALAFAGMGKHSLDQLLGLQHWYSASVAWIAIGIAVVFAMLNLAARRPLKPTE